jgi:hypothetical protein
LFYYEYNKNQNIKSSRFYFLRNFCFLSFISTIASLVCCIFSMIVIRLSLISEVWSSEYVLEVALALRRSLLIRSSNVGEEVKSLFVIDMSRSFCWSFVDDEMTFEKKPSFYERREGRLNMIFINFCSFCVFI